ncbi:hypothetical protein O181_066263 [Austropuccinia psidii MF-1]|uniref:Uncharacterized protein n=1 Tax=Austropuccinia psidii MF-1 TaxID=1389203 RepID=A0A9Q3ER37_9BASI|nr:hypothetical protein [Austropuccinia psidii MF-1]
MSHHKKPVRPSLSKSHLFISTGSRLQLSSSFIDNDQDHAFIQNAFQPWRSILHHPFTSQINLIQFDGKKPSLQSPSSIKTDELIKDITNSGTYQFFPHFLITHLLEPDFVQTYLRSGNLIALSISQRAGDDIFALDGYGKIHLRLNSSTYQRLGLPGRPSKFGPSRQYFIVEINMRDHAMRTGKPLYEKTKRCLNKFPNNPLGDLLASHHGSPTRLWNVVMSWVDEKGQLKPIKFSSLPSASSVKTCYPKLHFQERALALSTEMLSNCSSVDTILQLYQLVGEANLLISEPGAKTTVLALCLEAIGFFHPVKLAQLSEKIISVSSFISLTAHTAPSSPFSFLTKRQTHPPPLTLPVENRLKKVKKGRSVMHGPERGASAGPSSWTIIAFEPQTQDLTNYVSVSDAESKSSVGQKRTTAEITSNVACEVIIRKAPKLGSISPGSTFHYKHQWILYESTANEDTHC